MEGGHRGGNTHPCTTSWHRVTYPSRTTPSHAGERSRWAVGGEAGQRASRDRMVRVVGEEEAGPAMPVEDERMRRKACHVVLVEGGCAKKGRGFKTLGGGGAGERLGHGLPPPCFPSAPAPRPPCPI